MSHRDGNNTKSDGAKAERSASSHGFPIWIAKARFCFRLLSTLYFWVCVKSIVISPPFLHTYNCNPAFRALYYYTSC